MLRPGQAAPTFDCSAIVDREVVKLSWNQLHEGRTIVFRFDSVEDGTAWRDDLAVLNKSAEDFDRHLAKVAVVCRDDVFEILQWANRTADEEGSSEMAFVMIADSDARIASTYDMLDADGCALRGHVVVDPVGKVRMIAKSSFHVGPNVDELIRCVASIGHERSSFAQDVPPCHNDQANGRHDRNAVATLEVSPVDDRSEEDDNRKQVPRDGWTS